MEARPNAAATATAAPPIPIRAARPWPPMRFCHSKFTTKAAASQKSAKTSPPT